MEIILKSISELKNYKYNARVHSDDQIDQIVASIRKFGFNDPIEVSEDLTIISGHARVEAAKRLGLKKLPVVIHSHMSEDDRIAYTLAANKIALGSTWDLDILKEELETLQESDFDLTLTGFTQNELDDMLGDKDFNPASEGEQGSLDILDPKNVVCPHCNKLFDLRKVE